MSVPLSGRLSRPALSPVCLSGPSGHQRNPTLPPTFTRTSSRRKRGRQAPGTRLDWQHSAAPRLRRQIPRPGATASRPALPGPRSRPVMPGSARVDDLPHSAASRATAIAPPLVRATKKLSALAPHPARSGQDAAALVVQRSREFLDRRADPGQRGADLHAQVRHRTGRGHS
jgi:hypothetical protein